MKIEQFKTNVMCSSCIKKVTPVLNEHFGEGKWSVDTNDPRKILTISSDAGSEAKVISVLDKAGYKAESLN